MGLVLISRAPTGRRWGNKIPETRKGAIVMNDVWEGPVEAGEQGEYHRLTWRDVDAAHGKGR